MSAGAERAIAWRHGYHAAVCSRIEPWAHGTVARGPDVPTYYDYNLARAEGGDPGLEAEALAAAAEPSLEGLAHRRIEVEDLAAGARLRPGFEAMGWVTERLAFLHRELPGPEVAAPAGATLRVDGFEASRLLRLAWQGESPWNDPPDFVLIEEAVAARRARAARSPRSTASRPASRPSRRPATRWRSSSSSACPSAAAAGSAARWWRSRWRRPPRVGRATR